MPTDPKHCLLNVIDELGWEESTRVAITRVMFMARKLIMTHWISEEPPAHKEWINAIGELLQKEKIIYQHRGCPQKFEKIWGLWLNVPGLAPVDLVVGRLLGMGM